LIQGDCPHVVCLTNIQGFAGVRDGSDDVEDMNGVKASDQDYKCSSMLIYDARVVPY